MTLISLFVGVFPARALADTFLSSTAQHSSVQLQSDGLTVAWGTWETRAIRTEVGIPPRSGVYYLEARRLGSRGDIGWAFGPADAPLDADISSAPGVFSYHIHGGYYHSGEYLIYQQGEATDFGFVVDYRGDFPIIHSIHALEFGNPTGPPGFDFSYAMEEHRGPLYFYVYGGNEPGQPYQAVNLGNDLVNAPFAIDARTLMANRFWQGDDQFHNRWYDPNLLPPTVSPSARAVTVVSGATVNLSATASDPQDGTITSSISWSSDRSARTGIGGTFAYSSTVTGLHTVTASVVDVDRQSSTAAVRVHVIADGTVDNDGDGLDYTTEVALGTNPSVADSDGDGLSDGAEVGTHGSSPLLTDSDGDLMPDGWEVRYGLSPITADGSGDLDLDGHTNLAEYQDGRDPGSSASYPGRGRVVLDPTDAHPDVLVSADGLGVSFAATASTSSVGARSDVAIQPSSGWYYFEGRRETAPGDYGFGVATSSASLSMGGGADNQSFGVTATGEVRYGGAVVGSIRDPLFTRHYGIAIDYTGTTPLAYVITDCVPDTSGQNDGLFCDPVAGALAPVVNSTEPVHVLGPYTLSGITGPLHAHVYGSSVIATEQQTLNFGADPDRFPFHFKASYILFNEGFVGAEYMGSGWGPDHTYIGRETPEQMPVVRMAIDEDTNWGVQLSDDGLQAAYGTLAKSAVTSNQGMIGEFRYFEGRRLIRQVNSGIGLITAYGQKNPVPFMPAPPCMSVNTLGSVWRNLVSVRGYDISATHYGFAVDYRGARPIVHVVINNVLTHTMTLTDVFLPLYPMLYGDTTYQAELVNAANFGASPFYYDVRSILSGAGVDTSELVLGWGDANLGAVSNRRPNVNAGGVGASVPINTSVTLTASADDPEDGNLTSSVEWSVNGSTVAVGGSYTYLAQAAGPIQVVARATDSLGLTGTATLSFGVVDPTATDTDGDGLSDATEQSLGTNPNLADTDGDGLSDGLEVNVHGTSPVLADTDGDGIPDAYEIDNGLNATVNDASLDLDGDGSTNLEEYQQGTNPNDAASFPGAATLVRLSDTDRDPSVTISPDGLGAVMSDPSDSRGVRSTVGIAPGSGFFYYEGTRTVATGDYGFGVATSSSSLRSYGGSSLDSFGVNVSGSIWGDGGFLASFSGVQDTYGFAVDYRGSSPVVYAITSSSLTGPGSLVYTHPMPSVDAPLYIYVYGTPIANPGQVQQTINPGDRSGIALRYDPRAILSAAGVSGASQLSPGWNIAPSGPVNRSPVLSVNEPDRTVTVDTPVTFTVTATDAEDGLLSGSVVWTVTGTSATGAGGSFTFTPRSAGTVTVTASVTDSGGASVSVLRLLTATNPADSDGDGLTDAEELTLGTDPNLADTDGDGLSDGAEVNTHLTSPTLADSDADGLPDGYEVQYGLLPNTADGSGDADGDGATNLEEYTAGTLPNDASSTPAPVSSPAGTVMNPNDRGPGVTISADGRSVNFTASDHAGVRSNNGVAPGQGVYYFEVHRNTAADDFGAGLSSSGAPLTGWLGDGPNVAVAYAPGHVLWNEQWFGSFDPSANADYGFVVDYRGTSPILHLVTVPSGGTGSAVHSTVDMTTVTSTVFIHLYGTSNQPFDILTINAGDDLSTRPYAHDPGAALRAAGLGSTADALVLTWDAPPPNRAPAVSITTPAQNVALGSSLTLTATASDPEDGDVSGSIVWADSLSAATGSGGTFSRTFGTAGAHRITARATDLGGLSTTATVVITVQDLGTLDSDGDGLTDSAEVSLGTNPNVADTDGDGLTDGAEVNTHASNPLQSDSDGDGMPDGFEVQYGLQVTTADASGDLDGDGVTNLAEHTAGTDPSSAASFPGAPTPTVLNPSDAGPNVRVSSSGLRVRFDDPDTAAVRSNNAVAPGSGFYYFEGRRLAPANDFGFGVSTATAALTGWMGAAADTYIAYAPGHVLWNEQWFGAFDPLSEYYGLAVDYRGANPTVHLIVLPTGSTTPTLHSSVTLTTVTSSVYIHVFGTSSNPGDTLELNASGAGYHYDPATVLGAGGVDTSALNLVWAAPPPNRPPQVSLTSPGPTAALGSAVSFSALATDPEDGDLTGALEWSDSAGPATGTGATFTVTFTSTGTHVISARVTDAGSLMGLATASVLVQSASNLDSDGDGLSDADEVALGTNPNLADSDGDGLSDSAEVNIHLSNPLLADTDGDGIRDDVEVQYGLQVGVADASGDLDGDGVSNGAEVSAGTAPNDALDYPGAPIATVLNPSDAGPNVRVSSSGLRVRFEDPDSVAVRSNNAIAPGSGFYYFEGRRLHPANDFGFGVSTSSAALTGWMGSAPDTYIAYAPGHVLWNEQWFGSFDPVTEYYGIAVDYTGTNPVVHLIVLPSGSTTPTLHSSVTLSTITTDLYIHAFGTSDLAGDTLELNAGEGGVAYHYDPATILGAAGVAGVASLNLQWNALPASTNAPPTVTVTSTVTTVALGSAVSFTAAAQDAEDGSLTSSIVWRDGATGNTGSGGTFATTMSLAGTHTITASVSDSGGASAVASFDVEVVDPNQDTDGDGLTDVQEAQAGTSPTSVDSDADGLTDFEEVRIYSSNPLSGDTDGDGIGDEYEVQHGLQVSTNDAALDLDGDGSSNLAEFQGGTPANNATFYPGSAATQTRLSLTDRATAARVTADGLGVHYSGTGGVHRGARSNLAVGSGEGVFYFEGHRERASADYGFGVATSTHTLNDFGGSSDQGLGVNVGGTLWTGGSYLSSFSAAATDTYGFVVDYRGAHPVVHIIVSTTAGGAGVVQSSVTLSRVIAPLHILVYSSIDSGGRTLQTINAGDDLISRPYRFNPVSALSAAGLSGGSVLQPVWRLAGP